MKTAFSEDFEYDKVDYIIECDASYDSSNAGIGWIVFTSPIETPVLEGMKSIESGSSVESEVEAIRTSLSEVRNINESLNVIIRTDYSGIIDRLSDENEKSEKGDLEEELSSFDTWCVECVNRGELSRAHDLANHSLQVS